MSQNGDDTLILESLTCVADAAFQRILTQVCRDVTSPFFGCADRNWWHYKIRDFPSIILQQAGYAIAIGANLPIAEEDGAALRQLAAGSCNFWNVRAVKYGAFEEYYPFEQGYPPLAFSTLSSAKIVELGIVDLDQVRDAFKVAIGQILTRFEAEAANQQIAGVAAVAVLREMDKQLVNEDRFQRLLDRSLGLQTEEGWFPEYDGPDLGYLSVTIDCLFDILDSTGDHRCRVAIEKAFDFIAWFVLSPFHAVGMHNSRNTDYLVPYGLTRLAVEPWARQPEAQVVLERLFGASERKDHFLWAVDDRYWCHYIGHSVFRAIKVLTNSTSLSIKVDTGRHGRLAVGNLEKPVAGHLMHFEDGPMELALLMSGRKGGIFTAIWTGTSDCWLHDFGWIIEVGGRQFVNHWYSQDWSFSNENRLIVCSGYLVSHIEHQSDPLKHLLLRAGSFALGRRLIKVLKQMLIFKKKPSPYYFKRSISIEGGIIRIDDEICGLPAAANIMRAPRASKRHVASADSFHQQDLRLSVGVLLEETREKRADAFFVSSKFRRRPV